MDPGNNAAGFGSRSIWLARFNAIASRLHSHVTSTLERLEVKKTNCRRLPLNFNSTACTVVYIHPCCSSELKGAALQCETSGRQLDPVNISFFFFQGVFDRSIASFRACCALTMRFIPQPKLPFFSFFCSLTEGLVSWNEASCAFKFPFKPRDINSRRL